MAAKLKSLKETRWTRLRTFLRGLLLYNTVYWRRASDGVDRSASRVGRAERQNKRPRVDPGLLRPRMLPANTMRRETPGDGSLRAPAEIFKGANDAGLTAVAGRACTEGLPVPRPLNFLLALGGQIR